MSSTVDQLVPSELSQLSLSESEVVGKGECHEHKRSHRHGCDSKRECDNRRECDCQPEEDACDEVPVNPYVPYSLLKYSSGEFPTTLIDTVPVPVPLTSLFPLVLADGDSAVQLIDGLGQFSIPLGTIQAGAYSAPIPFQGRVKNLEVSVDALVIPELPIPSLLNTVGVQFDFTVFVSRSTPNNGIDHASQPYLNSSLTTSVRFGAPANTTILADASRTASALNQGMLAVYPGDRIGVRVRTAAASDLAVLELLLASFNASLSYERLAC